MASTADEQNNGGFHELQGVQNQEGSGPVNRGLNRATSGSSAISMVSELSESNDGCIILGKDGGRGNQYVTRFRIQRRLQFHSLSKDICKEECLPCAEEESRTSICKFIWTLINSEPLLLCLHLSAVILGALKEGLNLKEVDEDLHIIASTVETYVALQVVVVRTVGAWQGYKSLSKARKKVEYMDSHDIIQSPHLKRAVHFITAVGVLLCIGAITAYGIFFHFRHLTWTILSNNFCIIIITASSGLLMGRIDAELSSITGDQHKAVLYEAMLLMTEGIYANPREAVVSKIDRFCKALRDTNIFEKPEYIFIPQEHKLKMNLVPSLQLQSFV